MFKWIDYSYEIKITWEAHTCFGNILAEKIVFEHSFDVVKGALIIPKFEIINMIVVEGRFVFKHFKNIFHICIEIIRFLHFLNSVFEAALTIFAVYISNFDF